MEKIKIVGIRDVDFTDKNGRQVTGVSLYYLYHHDRVRGEAADKVFVPSGRFQNFDYVPQLGDEVYAHYDRFGKVSEFTPVKSA